ncbi:hypothetical protein RCH06_002060 [Polaromonas sp. CG_9.5]|nr:hypothetical protein [Polaromonas sp. CG_9.5]
MVIASLTGALKIMKQKPEDPNDPPCHESAEECLAQYGFFLNDDLQGSLEGIDLAAQLADIFKSMQEGPPFDPEKAEG